MLDYSKIAILSTVINFELYNKTSKLFPSTIKKYVIDGTNGMHGIHSIKYMMKVLKNKGIEWLIMADEDVIFEESEIVFSIINQMEKHNYSVCGVRDGGVISHRNYNPYVINTFFSILKFKEIEEDWNVKEVLNNQYILKNEFDENLNFLKYKYDINSLYEPYYCFYFWLKRKEKQTLFLDVNMNADGITNEVYFNNELMLHHTWYARSYDINEKHTIRINNILNNLETNTNNAINDFDLWKDKYFFIKKFYNKFKQKIKSKLYIK